MRQKEDKEGAVQREDSRIPHRYEIMKLIHFESHKYRSQLHRCGCCFVFNPLIKMYVCLQLGYNPCACLTNF